MKNKVLLSFDVEEFDLPREHGMEISLEEGVGVSSQGLERVIEMLKRTKIRATFFCTGNFANAREDLIKKIVSEGHEVACHGVDHFKPNKTDIEKSKKIIEKIAGVKVYGYRQPRMQKNNYGELKKWGYKYDSSVNPAFIPGRYNNLKVPRDVFKKEGIIEVPTSVATFMRVPMFWLALHLFPLKLFINLAKNIAKKGYFGTYFHPWEFADIYDYEVVPGYIRYNSGRKMVDRLETVIKELKKAGCEFITYYDYIEKIEEK